MSNTVSGFPATRPQRPNGFGVAVVVTADGISIGGWAHLSWRWVCWGLAILVGLTSSVFVGR